MPSFFLKYNIKALRKGLGLTQAQLAIQLGRKPQSIGNWETGFNEPTIDDLIQLSIIFGVTLDELLISDVSEGKVNKEVKNEPNGKVNGKVTGKVSSKNGDFGELERLKKELAGREEILASKDEIIASLKQNNNDLRSTISILSDEITRLKRAISDLERQIESHSGGSDASGHRRSA
jgi:transcriptional regulator with XRE-family HTH domain